MGRVALQQPGSVPGRRIGRVRLAPAWLALLLGLLTLVLVAGAAPLSVAAHQATTSDLLVLVPLPIPFAVVGVVVANRQPRNPIGWILLILACGLALGADAGYYSVYAYRVHHHDLPLSRLAVVLATGWVAFVLLPLPIILFPNGRLDGRRWRPTLWVYLALTAAVVVFIAAEDMRAFTDRPVKINSSGALVALGASASGVIAVAAATFVILALISVSWVARQVVRYRRSTGDEHQQLKWLMSGGAIAVIGFLVSDLLSNARSEPWQALATVGPLAIVALPLGIGVGILKYRLYDIDRLISRTISYTIVTGLLGGVFTGLVVFTTRALPLSSSVGVAASTLAAAALFNPLRRRTQRLVDHRFNRTRYNAEKSVAEFTARLRDAVDVNTVRIELLAAVNQAIAPSHASVWVKPTNADPRTH